MNVDSETLIGWSTGCHATRSGVEQTGEVLRKIAKCLHQIAEETAAAVLRRAQEFVDFPKRYLDFKVEERRGRSDYSPDTDQKRRGVDTTTGGQVARYCVGAVDDIGHCARHSGGAGGSGGSGEEVGGHGAGRSSGAGLGGPEPQTVDKRLEQPLERLSQFPADNSAQ
jgi:hypothetical protein